MHVTNSGLDVLREVQTLTRTPLTADEIAYLKVHQPTRAMMLGLLPYPEKCLGCGSPDGCVCD